MELALAPAPATDRIEDIPAVCRPKVPSVVLTVLGTSSPYRSQSGHRLAPRRDRVGEPGRVFTADALGHFLRTEDPGKFPMKGPGKSPVRTVSAFGLCSLTFGAGRDLAASRGADHVRINGGFKSRRTKTPLQRTWSGFLFFERASPGNGLLGEGRALPPLAP